MGSLEKLRENGFTKPYMYRKVIKRPCSLNYPHPVRCVENASALSRAQIDPSISYATLVTAQSMTKEGLDKPANNWLNTVLLEVC